MPTPRRKRRLGMVFEYPCRDAIVLELKLITLSKLRECEESLVGHPREMLDLVCVADLATWSAHRLTSIPITNPNAPTKILGYTPGTMYVRPYREEERDKHGAAIREDEYTPIGGILTDLMTKLAWEHPDMRELNHYFRRSNLDGSGLGETRSWSHEIFSDEVKTK